MKKKILIFLVAIILLVGFVALKEIKAADDWLNISSSEYDSHCGDSSAHTPQGALDGTDYWAHYANEIHWLVLDLGQTYTIKSVRGRSNRVGFDPTDINIYVSDDKGNWGAAVATGISTWQDTSDWVEIDTFDKDGQYIKIEIVDTEDWSNRELIWGTTPTMKTIFDAYGHVATAAVAPSVTTNAATSVEETTATGNGNITATGGENCHTRGICWNTSPNPTTTNDKSEDDGAGSYGIGEFSKSMTGLLAGTHYYVRAYAINSEGTSYGGGVEFDTKSVGAPELIDGLVSYWKLDESEGDAIDAHGNNDGSVIGATQGVAGKINTAYDFDGDGDYVDVSDTSLHSQSFTVSLWFNRQGDGGGVGAWDREGLFSIADDRNRDGWRLSIVQTNKKIHWGAFSDIGVHFDGIYSDTVVTNDTWYHVAVTRNSTNILLYINGDLENTVAVTDDLTWTDVVDIIGRFSPRSDYYGYFNGTIDEVAIWSRALDGDDITALYNNGVGLAYSFEAVEIPTVTTQVASSVEETTATLNGNVTSDGGAAITERGFYCDTNESPSTKYVISGTTGIYTKDLTGLSANTKYYFKAFATNSEGTSYGDILNFTTSAPAPPPASLNVYGWAWSDNIGWISFNCDNPELASCSTSNYGVNIDSAGNFSGYAWAGGGENADSSLAATIGWIKFDPAGPYPEAPFYSARLDLGDYTVSGWARAYRAIEPEGQTLGGWDGWIKLSGTWANGVSFNTGTDEFEGWAWGSDVIGWISFNCEDREVATGKTCLDFLDPAFNPAVNLADYKVTTALNQSPNKPFDLYETWDCCGGTPQVALRTCLILNWSIFNDPDSGDFQQAYEVEINTSPTFNHVANVEGSEYTVDAVNGDDDGDWSSFFSWDATYNWRVKVQDNNDNWSEFSELGSFTLPKRASPKVDFTPNPINPRTGEEVSFEDVSKCYLSNDSFYSCKNEFETTGEDDISYAWDFDYDGSFEPTDWTEGNAIHTYPEAGVYIVRLEITDIGVGGPFTGMCSEEVAVGFPLPTWREIAPF